MTTSQRENNVGNPRRVLLTALSAKDGSNLAKALERLGCQVYMSSPIRIEELEQLVDLLNPSVLIVTNDFGEPFIDLYRRIKAPPHRALLPVVVVASDPHDRNELIEAGTDAVISPPWVPADLASAVSGILERADIVDQHKEIDGLTGVFTEPMASSRLEYEVARARRYRHPGCLGAVALDNYETVRTSVGQLAADAGLKRFAQILQGELREVDMVGRVAGRDRFLVIMPDTGLTGAVQAMRRILSAVGTATVDVPGCQDITLSASGGVGEFGSDGCEAIVRRVDDAVERAIEAGGSALFTA